MKKRIYEFLLLLLLAVLLSGCGTDKGVESAQEENLALSQSASEEEMAEEKKEAANHDNNLQKQDIAETPEVNQFADTYWTAVAYQQKDNNTWLELPAAASESRSSWWLDLFLYADGTMRLRDVSGNFYDGLSMAGKWEESADGILVITEGNHLYEGYRPSGEMVEEELPVFVSADTAVLEKLRESSRETPLLAMQYYGGYIYFQQAPMPGEDRQLCMADMKGSWTMISGEIEGSVYGVEEGILTSIAFEEGKYLTEAVHTSFAKYVGEITEFRASVFYREEPLYEGCGNESWSVELRPQSLGKEDDEYYATLLDEDTLLLQHFYTIDGIRFVNNETYIRGSEAKDALTLQKELQSVLAQHPANTLFCIGTDLYAPSDPGVETLMEVVRLTEEESQNTMMLLCPEYVKLLVYWNGEVIHETELGHMNTELFLLKIPQKNGVCQFTFTSDFENWYTLEISRETFHTPKWISVLNPEK